jgi:hypothetical protein
MDKLYRKAFLYGVIATVSTVGLTSCESVKHAARAEYAENTKDKKGKSAVAETEAKPTPTPDGKSGAEWSISGLYNKAASMIGGDKPKTTPTSEVIETEHFELKKTDAVQFTPAERGQSPAAQEQPTGPVVGSNNTAYNTDTGGKIVYRKGQSSSSDNNGMPWPMGSNAAATSASRERVVAVPGTTAVESAVKEGEIRTVETVTVIDGRVNTQPIHWTRQGNIFVTDQIVTNPSFIVTVAGGRAAKIVGTKWAIPAQVLQP